MQKAGSFALGEKKPEAGPVKLFRVVGILLVVIVPAAFWTTVILLVCRWLSVTLSAQTVALIGGSMCLFLGIIYAIIVLGASRSDDLNGIDGKR